MLKHLRPFSILLAAVLVFALIPGCAAKQVIILGAADTSSAETIAEIYAINLEKAGYRVERRYDMAAQGGDEHTLHHALKDGHIDIYVDYTGSVLTMLEKDIVTDPYSIYDALEAAFQPEGIALLEPIPANNTLTLAALQETADTKGLKTFSDVCLKAGELRIAVTEEFQQDEEGFKLLSERYGDFAFKEIIAADESQLYDLLKDKKADLAAVHANDGQLSGTAYKALRDDFHAFVPQILVPITKKEYIEQNPEIREIFNKISVSLNDKAVIGLNKRIQLNKTEYQVVAKEFLKDNKL
ncbi:MAG TPA: glycine betaine ABC transporter substrate-binding protein [Anaerovoracaceae bacterium]|nr:glycine betaine ABC transporter substrate-binding protein [Anaerovoracaceae bacterium]